jgi:hypothetical protein
MPMDQELIELIFRGECKRAELEPLCKEVLKHFQLPKQRLIAIFDDKERDEFTSSPLLGETFCGFFRAVRRFSCGPVRWPPEIMEHVWDKQDWRCDVVIYLRSRTCQSPTGTAITFAHELQHFMQYGLRNKAWQASHDIQRIFEESGRRSFPWDFPHEFEAQVVSRKVAESEDVRGKDEVRRYAEQQIELERDRRKWEFFLGPAAEKHSNSLRQ